MFGFGGEKCEAFIYNITPKGEPIVTENEFIQQYIVDLFNIRSYTVTITPLNLNWVNTSDANSVIPINQTDISTDRGNFNLAYNREQEIYSGSGYFSSSFIYTIKVRNVKGLKSGTYTSDFVFSSSGYNFQYTMQLNILPNSRITLSTTISKIILSDKDVFKINSLVGNDVNTRIDVDSNSNWELYLDTSNLGNLIGDYFFKIAFSSGNIDYVLPDNTQLLSGQNYLIARGQKTYDNNSPANIVPTNLQVRYFLRNSTGKFFKEGTYTNNLIYRIEEK